MASASGYNHQRFARAVLKKSRKWEPSLVVQLYQSHWRFENSPITFQLDGPMRPFILALRAQVIPASLIPFLYDIRPPVSFVDGCLVVEIQDYRKNPDVRSRVVMRPAAEALAQTIDVMLERRGEGWDEQMALEVESRIIAATSPPLYLGTSILATRNAVLAMSLTSPAGANLSADGTFRHPSHMEGDEASSVERMRKLLRAGERSGAFQPNWSILRLKERLESAARLTERERPPDMVPIGMGGANGGGEVEKPKKSKKKRPAEDEVGDKEKKSKKQKVEDGGGGGRGEKKKKQSAQGQGEVEKEKEKERDKDKDKPNKEKKKKKDEEQGLGLGLAGFSG